MKKGIRRLGKYFLAGASTFVFDFSLLVLLTESVGINYVISSAIAFVVSMTLNYSLVRVFVFKYSDRGIVAGYNIFILIAVVGLILVVGLMALFVEIFNWNYMISRIIIAFIVGLWNYLMNLRINF